MTTKSKRKFTKAYHEMNSLKSSENGQRHTHNEDALSNLSPQTFETHIFCTPERIIFFPWAYLIISTHF